MDIQSISESVGSGEPLTPEEYEVLANSSDNEIVAAVGAVEAAELDVAYDAYVEELIANAG